MGRKLLLACASGVIVVIFVGLSLAVGEVAIRSVHLLRDDIPFFESPAGGKVGPITLDSELGWKATEHYQEVLVEKTKKGVPYEVRRSQKQYGFRRFGDVQSRKPKLLVIGDSFTQATAVSDDRTYHALLETLLGVEVFAYGAGGYGTLQELLILERYLDVIEPDAILWQFCMNDFINNDNDLERQSVINNNGWTRPYWRNGAVVMLSPKESAVQVREWINRHSRFLYFIVSRVDRLRASAARQTVEIDIENVGMAHPGFRRAMETTDRLMGRVRERVGQRPIMAFNCVQMEPYSQAFRNIANHYGVEYWDDVAEGVRAAETRGEDVLTLDDHWNERGHEIVAHAIAKHVRARGGIAVKRGPGVGSVQIMNRGNS